MKVIVEQKLADRAIKSVSTVIASKPVQAIMGGIRFVADGGTLSVSATNGNVDVLCNVSCDVVEPGEVVLDGKKVASMFSTLPSGAVKINADIGKPNVTIQGVGGSKFTVAKIEGDFPEREPMNEDGVTAVEIAGGDLWTVLNTVKYAVATEESRPVLTGVLMEIRPEGAVQCVALDGFRMGVCRRDCRVNGELAEERAIILPITAVNAIVGNCEESQTVHLYTDGTAIRAVMDGMEITATLLAGTYADYKPIIPREWHCSARFMVDSMSDALKRALVISNSGKNNLVKLTVHDGSVLIESNSPTDSFSEEVPCQHSGDDMRTAYNAKYMREVLTATRGEEMQLDLLDGLKAGVMKPVNAGRELHILLPVRVVNDA